jgi:hypothetical protein
LVSRSSIPWQLRTKHRRRKGHGRPLMESLPCLDIRVLAKRKMFPGNWADQHEYNGYIAPNVSRLILSRRQVEIWHSNIKQAVPLYWQRGFGLRPIFVCSCGRRAFVLRLSRQAFRCYRCCHALYLSQAVDSRHRPVVQAKRIRRFLDAYGSKEPKKPAPMHWRSFHRILGQLRGYEARSPKQWHSQKITDPLLKPLQVYRTQMDSRRA